MAAQAGITPILPNTNDPIRLAEDDAQGRITAVAIMLIALSTVIVGLRFVARHLSKAGLWWDDWLILAALLISWGPCISMLVAVSHGFGRHMDPTMPLEERIELAQEWFQILHAFSTLYTFAITLAKYSILLFYSRIFKERKFLIALRIVFGLVTLWFVAIQIAVFAECVPITAMWDPTVDGTCIDFLAFYQGSGIPNVVFNTAILVLPLPMIWSLDIDRRHKIALSGVFLLGSFVVIVSIIRLVYLGRLIFPPVDITWTYIDAGIWTAVEPSVAVISASLPILRSLWVWNRRQRTARRTAANPSLGGSSKMQSYHSRIRPNTKKDIYSSLSDQQLPLKDLPAGAQHAWGNHVAVYAGTPSGKTSGDDSYYADLPIMRPALSGLQQPKKAHPRPDLSELYGS